MWVGLIESVEGLNRIKKTDFPKQEWILQQTASPGCRSTLQILDSPVFIIAWANSLCKSLSTYVYTSYWFCCSREAWLMHRPRPRAHSLQGYSGIQQVASPSGLSPVWRQHLCLAPSSVPPAPFTPLFPITTFSRILISGSASRESNLSQMVVGMVLGSRLSDDVEMAVRTLSLPVCGGRVAIVPDMWWQCPC